MTAIGVLLMAVGYTLVWSGVMYRYFNKRS